jgi:hypothetical protein
LELGWQGTSCRKKGFLDCSRQKSAGRGPKIAPFGKGAIFCDAEEGDDLAQLKFAETFRTKEFSETLPTTQHCCRIPVPLISFSRGPCLSQSIFFLQLMYVGHLPF